MPDFTKDLARLRHWNLDEPRPSFRDLLIVVFRHIGLIGSTFLISFLTALIYISHLPDIYEAQVEFLVTRERVEPTVSTDMTSLAQRVSSITLEEMNSEIQLLRSRNLLRQLVAQEPAEQPETKQTLLDDFLRRVQLLVRPEPTQEEMFESRIRRIERTLDISRIRDSNTIRARYTSEDPKNAVSVLERLCSLYLAKHVVVRRAGGAHEFFRRQTERYKEQVRVNREALAAFNSRFDIVSADTDRQTALAQTAEFDSELRRTIIELGAAEDQASTLVQQIDRTAPRVTTEVRTSPRLSEEEQATLLALQRKRTELLQRFQPTYPLVVEIEKQIAQSQAAIRRLEQSPPREEATDANPTHQWLEAELASAQSRVASLRAKAKQLREAIAESKLKLTKLDQLAIRQRDLIRDTAIQEENYLKAVRRQEEARVSDDLDNDRILNVAIAEYPTLPVLPTGPERPLLGAVGFLTALVFSIGIAFIRDRLASTLRTPEEVERYLGVPVIASIPKRLGRTESSWGARQ